MDGRTLTRIVSEILEERGISVEDLCKAIGISQSAYSQWKYGRTPKPERITAIENYLGVKLSDYEEPEEPDEITRLREILRSRSDLRTLLSSASDMPPSSVYKLISDIERGKENERQRGLSD